MHINAGIAGLVGALMIGKRIGYGKELMAPHSLTMSMIGASLLWVGWFGFNAGSNLEATGGAALAMINTFVATAAAAMSWMFVEWAAKGKPSLLGALSGCVAGLVAVTPAAGFSGPMGAIVLGLIAGAVCFFFCTTVKNALGYDNSLDVFGVHCIGGIIGALLTGILVNPALGGAGIMDYTVGKIAEYDLVTQMCAQFKAVLTTLIWSGVGSFVLFWVVNLLGRAPRHGRGRARRPRHLRAWRARLHDVRVTVWGGFPAPPLAVERPRLTPGPLAFCGPLCRWLIAS